MNNVVVASSEADSTAMDAVVQHHAEIAASLAARVDTLVDAAARGHSVGAENSRDELVAWLAKELLPHAAAEERTIYPLAHEDPTARLLVDAMLEEHQLLKRLVQQLHEAPDPVRAATTAGALHALFESHLAKENELILPLLASSARVALADALHGMHEILGPTEEAHPGQAQSGCGGGGCACGESDPEGVLPELDARSVPHAIRHATIFGALDAVRPGGGLVLVAPHDPVPLLAQLEQRSPGVFDVDYLERGPEAWRLAFRR